uniref:ADP-ribosyl cyclase/cyclic ADP-ribose hydrolase n=1 Tax=Macrostomum lignano TaxID=282301 RepID=A0A1I8JAP9_9PLAT
MIARESVLLPLLLLVVLHFLPIQQAQLPDEASLMAIFVGRCNEFQLLRHPELFPQISSRKNCSRLWEEFRFVALQPDHCRPEPDDFAGLLQMANHEIPVDKFVFWSGTAYSLVIRVRDMPEYFPLEETLIGFIMNSMDWCNYRCDVNTRGSKISLRRRRSTNSQVTRRESCTNFTLPFWIAASSWDLRPVRAAPAQPPRISQVDVYPLRSLNDPRLASAYSACRMDPSVLRLRQRLLLKGVRVNCQDNPLFLVHTLCSESPQAERCQLIGRSKSDSSWLAAGPLRQLLWAAAAMALTACFIYIGRLAFRSDDNFRLLDAA